MYEQSDVAKKFLPLQERWRIVSFDLSDTKSFVDWPHEREWRYVGDFKFDISKVTVVVTHAEAFKKFFQLASTGGEDVSGLERLK